MYKVYAAADVDGGGGGGGGGTVGVGAVGVGQNQDVIPAPAPTLIGWFTRSVELPVIVLSSTTSTRPTNGNGASLVKKHVAVVVQVAI